MSKLINTKITKFLGLNESEDETSLQLGEASKCDNFKITDNYKLKKISGYKQLFASIGAHNVKGMWYGKISGTYHFLWACNGHIYKWTGTTNTDLGTLTDATTSFFEYGSAVYILNGHEYKKWTGTGTISDVTGYVPLVYTATPPSGGGTFNESINLLTGKKHQTFSGNNSSRVFYLAETNITSVDAVYLDGILQTLTTHYTVGTTAGTVTFVSTPLTGQDNVDIYWTKGTGSRAEVYENKYAEIYGGANDTRVFLYGDGTNRLQYSGLASGVPSAEYFPALGYADIGSSETKITGLTKHYDRLSVFKEKDTYYMSFELIDVGNGDMVASFPVYPLNSQHGNIAMGQPKVINNNPISISTGIYEWVANYVRDQNNAMYMSLKVQNSLNEVDLTNAIVCDHSSKYELWIAVGTTIWIYNYQLKVWYKHIVLTAPTCLLEINGDMYFGTSAGQIMHCSESYRDFNGSNIYAEWESGYYDAGNNSMEKYLERTWITLLPEDKSQLDISWITDRDPMSDPLEAKINNLTFEHMDLSDFSFLCNYNPQPMSIKTKARKWVYYKLNLKNDSELDAVQVISINYSSEISGQTRRR